MCDDMPNPDFPKGYAPEILTTGAPHVGPFIQIEGYGGDCVLTSAKCAGSATAWAGKTIFDGKPIEGDFFNIVIESGSLLGYKSRYK